ncbi:MAG: cobalamin biosynthesis protein CobD [Oscillibacter sp.]|nr:cobalamin biosynthesis protein CobD [Oscillibacter sp.]
MLRLWAMLCGFALDLFLGDPDWAPHPVVFMGRCIERMETFLRAKLPRTERGELLGGAVLAAVLPLGTLAVCGAACALAGAVHPFFRFLLETLWCWQALAVRGLAEAGREVYKALVLRDLPGARKTVARIVGRDTVNLDEEGVARAAVESVAENFSDGVAAPLRWFLLGGAPWAMAYKAVNTMDSMVGYRTPRYLYFGRTAAHLDDDVNLIPSRMAALCWIAASALTGQDYQGAWRIWRRDQNRHPSPNAGQTEAACAGALGIQLGGGSQYFGVWHIRPTLGDDLRPIEPEDIARAVHTMLAASFLALAALSLLRLLWAWIS